MSAKDRSNRLKLLKKLNEAHNVIRLRGLDEELGTQLAEQKVVAEETARAAAEETLKERGIKTEARRIRDSIEDELQGIQKSIADIAYDADERRMIEDTPIKPDDPKELDAIAIAKAELQYRVIIDKREKPNSAFIPAGDSDVLWPGEFLMPIKPPGGVAKQFAIGVDIPDTFGKNATFYVKGPNSTKSEDAVMLSVKYTPAIAFLLFANTTYNKKMGPRAAEVAKLAKTEQESAAYTLSDVMFATKSITRADLEFFKNEVFQGRFPNKDTNPKAKHGSKAEEVRLKFFQSLTNTPVAKKALAGKGLKGKGIAPLGLDRSTAITNAAMTPRQLNRRFNVLGGEISAGQNNPDAINEFLAIADTLYDKNRLSQRRHEQAYRVAGMA